MLFVITGGGKGKTTSALGMVARAIGQKMKCYVLQFIKDNVQSSGEYHTFTSLGVGWESFGEGFLWNQKTFKPTKRKCLLGWERFKSLCLEGNYDLIVLDEFTYVLNYEFLPFDEVFNFLSEHVGREGFPHIVITGREAPEKLVELADTVSFVSEVKHHYRSNGGKTVRGIEF